MKNKVPIQVQKMDKKNESILHDNTNSVMWNKCSFGFLHVNNLLSNHKKITVPL